MQRLTSEEIAKLFERFDSTEPMGLIRFVDAPHPALRVSNPPRPPAPVKCLLCDAGIPLKPVR